VFAEETDHFLELGALGLRGRVLHVLRVRKVASQERITHRRALTVALDERVDGRLQLRTVLAEGPGDLAARPDLRLFVQDDLREDLLPELRDGRLDDGRGNET